MMHDLLQAVRDVDNRNCAECEAQIGDVSSAFAVLDFGVWVCNECANSFMESGILSASNRLKTCAEDWTPEEVNLMLNSTSNKAVNSIYERHVTPNWNKVNPKSARAERINWILAKYKGKLFVFPQRSLSSSSPPRMTSKDGHPRPSMDICPESTELPMRLLDFFAVVSIGDFIPPLDDGDVQSSTPQVEELEFAPVISSCVPDPESLPDTPLPEHLGMFIFPNGVHLSSTEISPTFFTFVLTDTSGVKLYGGVLHIHELAGPAEVEDMLEHSDVSSKFVYVPKALVVLSHYPFFNLFYNVLKQLYRISLSSCPLSMERYVSYVMQETPLPPLGCTRVTFPLADGVFLVSRPPRNQLPMIDFSYRPLFTMLSVKNILTVFSFICAEHKVCFASKYLSILTPVQESFLSFLFPLVWQGAYIPVMPASMLDLLDAPVPMLLGVERCHMFDSKALKTNMGSNVVIVDLDRDAVYVGRDDYGKSLEPLPMHAKDVNKLKDKLVEFGGCIHNGSNSVELIEHTLKAFPDNEHLLPIKKFVSSDGGARIPIVTEYETDDSVSVQSSHFFREGEMPSKLSNALLSPGSNTSEKDNFNAKEIRRAFLRFFVSSLRDMHSDNIRNESSSRESPRGPVVAKKKKKDQPELTKFMTELMNTQMLTFFSEERIYHPDHSEVKFFDESILDKLNRSVTTVNKITTPFLDDKSEHIYELYFCLPCSDETPGKHVYPRFPELSRAVKYNKKAIVLQREAEHRRKHDTKNQLQAVDMVISANTDRATRRSSIGLMRKESMLEFTLQEGVTNYKHMMKAVLKIQAFWKTAIVRKRYCIRRAVLLQFNMAGNNLDKHGSTIQRFIRKFLSRVTFMKSRAAITLQAIIRGFTKRKIFQRICWMTLKLQALYRMWKVRNSFKKIISGITQYQAAFRGHQTFKQVETYRKQCAFKLRALIFQLWMLSSSSLEYRSEFWKCVDKTSFLHLSLLIAEVKKLWVQLKYDPVSLNILRYPLIFTSVDSLDGDLQSKIKNGVPESLEVLNERKKFYMLMKSGIKDETHQRQYFEGFEITKRKKRKHDLTKSLLWRSLDSADISADIVLDLLDIVVDQKGWIIKQKAGSLAHYSMVRIVQEFMQTQQRLNNHSHKSV